MNPGDWWGHGFNFMWVMPLLFLVVLLFLVRGIFGQGLGGEKDARSASAREILDKRFAAGEISEDEYEVKKKALSDDG